MNSSTNSRLQKSGTKKFIYVFFAILVVYITATPVDSVVIKPAFDAGTVIQWRPVELKNELAILPGDKVEISFGYYIPTKADDVLIKMAVGKIRFEVQVYCSSDKQNRVHFYGW